MLSANRLVSGLLLVWLLAQPCLGGPYSQVWLDPANIYDAPVPGFVGPDGEGNARLLVSESNYQNPNNYVNPLFLDWVANIPLYAPSTGVALTWQMTAKLLGPVTGDHFDVVSLGDLDAGQESAQVSPGLVVLGFSRRISNLDGADFVVFENGFTSINGKVFADLGYVEVSSNGQNYVRFPSRSLTPNLVGDYGTIDATNVFNLVGKHANANGVSWGTPFDLADLTNDPLVLDGTIDLQHISHVRIVDIPGNGFYKDQTGASIYDAWLTSGSAGLDLEAVGIISSKLTFAEWATQKNLVGNDALETADPDRDGLPNLLEYAFARMPDRNDTQQPTSRATYDAGRTTIHFFRDERAVDLTYNVQVSSDLQNWTTLARSQNGQPFVSMAGYSPTIAEQSASPISSVGVVRAVSVTDVATTATARFMRVKVTH